MRNREIKALADYCLNNKIGDLIWKGNLEENDVKGLFKDSFWRGVMLAWTSTTYHFPVNKTQVRAQPIWYNSHIRCNGKPRINIRAIQNGLWSKDQLIDENGDFKEFDIIKQISNSTVSFTEYYGIKNSFNGLWLMILTDNRGDGTSCIMDLNRIVNEANPSKLIYSLLIDKPYALLSRQKK